MIPGFPEKIESLEDAQRAMAAVEQIVNEARQDVKTNRHATVKYLKDLAWELECAGALPPDRVYDKIQSIRVGVLAVAEEIRRIG